MNIKQTVLVTGVVMVVAVAAFTLGRMDRDRSTQPEVVSQPPADAVTPPAAELPAGHPQVAEPSSAAGMRDAANNAAGAVHFRVGRDNVKALLVDGDVIWAGTSSGLIRYLPKEDVYRKFDNSSGLLSNGVFYLGKIKGEIWVGTYGGGLSVLDPATEQWRNYNIPDGMADAFVYDVLETRTGDVWIATWSGANLIVDGDMDSVENWLLYTVENTDGGLPNDWVYGLSEGADGTIWVATEGGMARFDGETWTNWSHADGLGAPYELVEADMPFRNDPGQMSSHHARQKAEQGLEDIKVAYNPNYVVSLEIDGQGVVWAGTWGGGLSRFDGSGWQTYTVADGLPGNHVFALGRDRAGQIWVGTSRGLARHEDGRFTPIGTADGLLSEIVFSIAFAENGAAWIGGLGGVTWYPHGL